MLPTQFTPNFLYMSVMPNLANPELFTSQSVNTDYSDYSSFDSTSQCVVLFPRRLLPDTKYKLYLPAGVPYIAGSAAAAVHNITLATLTGLLPNRVPLLTNQVVTSQRFFVYVPHGVSGLNADETRDETLQRLQVWCGASSHNTARMWARAVVFINVKHNNSVLYGASGA